MFFGAKRSPIEFQQLIYCILSCFFDDYSSICDIDDLKWVVAMHDLVEYDPVEDGLGIHMIIGLVVILLIYFLSI